MIHLRNQLIWLAPFVLRAWGGTKRFPLNVVAVAELRTATATAFAVSCGGCCLFLNCCAVDTVWHQEDCEDAKFEWQNVLKLPFIDVTALLAVTREADAALRYGI